MSFSSPFRRSPVLAITLFMLAGACASDPPATTGSGGSNGTGTGGTSGTGTGGSGTGSGGSGTTTGSGGSGTTTGSGGSGTTTGTGGSGTTTGTGGTTGAGGSSEPSSGCTPGPLTMSGTLQGRYGTATVNAGGKEYFLQVNEWNSTATQTMAYGGDFFFKMTTQMASVPTTGGPTGFPSIFIGANSRHMTAGSNLPKAVSALTTVPTTWNWKDNGTLADTTANSYNVAYDVWFSTSAAGEPTASGPTGGYLMVWLYDPPDAQPIGRALYRGITIPGVSGTWDVWIGPNGTRPCISYVRTSPTMGMSFDLNAFIKDAVANRKDGGNPTIQNSWYLTNVFVGFEIWRGGQNLETTSFCAVVN